MKIIEEFQHGDGAHRGLSDWYPNKEAALALALKSKQPFDTRWYGSKHEIASARIHSTNGKQIEVEVSVSDDFDTPGNGRTTCDATISAIRKAISKAWSDAEKDQRSNRQYAGYSLIHWSTKIPEYLRKNAYPRETRKRYRSKQSRCLDYYIVNCSDWCGFNDSPPGDNYHHWGWQSDDNEKSEHWGENPDPKFNLSADVQEKLEDFAQSRKKGSLRIGDWEIKSWEDK